MFESINKKTKLHFLFIADFIYMKSFRLVSFSLTLATCSLLLTACYSVDDSSYLKELKAYTGVSAAGASDSDLIDLGHADCENLHYGATFKTVIHESLSSDFSAEISSAALVAAVNNYCKPEKEELKKYLASVENDKEYIAAIRATGALANVNDEKLINLGSLVCGYVSTNGAKATLSLMAEQGLDSNSSSSLFAGAVTYYCPNVLK